MPDKKYRSLRMNPDHADKWNSKASVVLRAGCCLIVTLLSPSPALSDDDQADPAEGSQKTELAAKPDYKGPQIGTVLGAPIFEGDLNPNQNAKDNLNRLVFQPLMFSFCKAQGIDRGEELRTRIKDEGRGEIVRFFVVRAELQRYLYEKYGGRVSLSAFGPTAIDGTKKWLKDRQQAGEFEITAPELRAQLDKLLTPEKDQALFASPEQIKEAFDPAITERFIEQIATMPCGAGKSSSAEEAVTP